MNFKKSFICFLAIILGFLFAGCIEDVRIDKVEHEIVSSAENEDFLYRTNTGECYHYGWCNHLISKIETSVYEIQSKGLRPCSKCKPPELGFSE